MATRQKIREFLLYRRSKILGNFIILDIACLPENFSIEECLRYMSQSGFYFRNSLKTNCNVKEIIQKYKSLKHYLKNRKR